MTPLTEMSDAELRAVFDDHEFRADGDQQMADWRYTVAIWPQLQREYPHEFIVMHKGEVVAHEPEFDRIAAVRKQLGLGLNEGLVKWVSLPTDPPLLL